MNELNITPLLDLAFVLLVIFIITTPQLVNNLELNLPSGKLPPQTGPKPKVHNIVVNKAGKISLNDAPMTLAELKNIITANKKDVQDAGVVVKGIGDVDYQQVVSVLDILQQLDIAKVGLSTQTAETAVQ
jgi:biopolymer transport protein ExbD